MKSNERSAVIYVPTDEKQLNITFYIGETVEDLCIKICKYFKIGPVARHLFALQSYSSKLWFPYGHKFKERENNRFNFRLRFKPCSIQKLKQIDKQAYDYYFHQIRVDIMNNKVPDIVYEKHKDELIGLGVSDMYRVMLEKQLPRETIEVEYKKYIPKECIKRHAFFVKKPIYNALAGISKEHLDASYVKEQYLQQFESMAPNYLSEQYKAFMDRCAAPAKVLLWVSREGIKYCNCNSNIQDWKTLCTIGDLCFISIGKDNTVEISRKDGIPAHFKFIGRTNVILMSFVSALDGYYRLSVKWTFNLCTEVITPTLERLHKLKCHGPIGKEFSYARLRTKASNAPGAYILRESETEYDVYYIDFCNKAGKPQSQRVEQIGPSEFQLSISDLFTQRYTCLKDLTSSFQDPNNLLYLKDCLLPTELELPLLPLLICASEKIVYELTVDENEKMALLEGEPRFVSQNQLQIFKAFCKNHHLTFSSSTTNVYRVIWRIANGKKLEIVMKILKNNSYTKEFLELAEKWGKLRSGTLVRLYGITVAPSMLLELVKLGPLDEYLRNNYQIIREVDMVKAAACLATALWYLEENHVVHGKIRCTKVFVHLHTDNKFIVKLGDPGLFTYNVTDIPWIPPECYADLASAKKSLQADIWALATTIWEIFCKGIVIPIYPNTDVVKKFYADGNRLPKPPKCPDGIYELMLECWSEKNTRKQPQAIMRDINQILYQGYKSPSIPHAYVYVPEDDFEGHYEGYSERYSEEPSERYSEGPSDRYSEGNYDYADVGDTTDDSEERRSNSESYTSNLVTDQTNLTSDDNDNTAIKPLFSYQENSIDNTEDLSCYLDCVINAMQIYGSSRYNHRAKCYGKMMEFNNDFLGQMQDISENGYWNVFIQELIGSGFYGEVYRGTCIRNNKSQQVAIKKLKTKTQADQKDFQREIEIMKTLKHRNIVKILGNISEPEICLVMEYVKYGSLQPYLRKNVKYLTSSKLLYFALDIATGMDYLGSMNIVHRDLAARNILVASETLVKISDFGLAQEKDANDYYMLKTVTRNLPMKWYAPESLKEYKFSSRSDVWSFGVTLYEIFTFGEDPNLPDLNYKNIMEKRNEEHSLVAALEKGKRLPCPPACSQEVYAQLMFPCWNIDSRKRPLFSTLCQRIQELLRNN